MQPVSFRGAIIDDLPAILDLLADDGLGRGREPPGLPLHPNYLRAFETIRSDPNQLLVVADRDGIIGCLQTSFWMHVPPGDRPRAFRKLATLLKLGGSC